MSTLFANRYAPIRELGRGGMGVVFAVRDTLGEGGELALKTIRHEQAITPGHRLRFKEEFLAMARLRHPNTVDVYDFGQLDAQSLYLTMELVPGRELTELAAGRALPVEQACKLLIQLLQALDFIHRRGYVHRDIKPENIRVRDDGTLKLMDFGLMTPLGQLSTRQISGTVGYLPPEVVAGGALEAASDLYSVGCLAYQLFTGRLPFEGTLVEVVRAHAGTRPEPARRYLPELPQALEALLMRLLAKQPSDRPACASEVVAELAAFAGVEVARPTAEQQRSYLTTSTLVGREQELDGLVTALAAARRGEGGAWLIGAPAGVGKSRLSAELAIRAKLDEMVVLHGACQDDVMTPYQGAAEALRPLLAASEPGERACAEKAIAALLGEGETCGGGELHDGVWQWMAAVAARRPVLWIMEDLHWADPQTLALFNHVARSVEGQAVLVVATFRDDEAPSGHPVWATLEEGTSRLLPLAPLTLSQQGEALHAMLREVRLSDDFAQALYQATGGNAFFLTSIVRALMEEGHLTFEGGAWHFPLHPDVLTPLASLNATIARRLAHLTPGARSLAAAAAVLGDQQDLDMLLTVSCLDEDVFFVRLEELILRQFIVRQGERHAFPHSRIREMLYEALAPEERLALHQRCAEYLEAYPKTDPQAVHELAHHTAHGQDPAKAYLYAMRAAEAAEAAGADALALHHWQRADRFLDALDLPDKRERQLALWPLIGASGFVLATDAAIHAFERLIAAHEETGAPPGVLAELYSMAAGAYAFRGEHQVGLQMADKACTLARDEDPLWRVVISTARSPSLVLQGRFDETRALARRVCAALEGEDLTDKPSGLRLGRVRALTMTNVGVFQGYRPDPAVTRAALEASAAFGDHSPMIAPSYHGLYAAWTGRQDEAQAYIDETLRRCRQLGAPPYPAVLYMQPLLRWQNGEFDQALSLVDKALASPHMRYMTVILQFCEVLRAQLLLDRGDTAGAEAAFAALEARGLAGEQHVLTILGRIGRGTAALALGETAAARPLLEQALAAALEGPARNPLYAIYAHRALGGLETVERRFAAADRHLRSALAIAQLPEQDNLLEQAHTWRALGDCQRAAGDLAAARPAWREAGTLYHQLKNLHGLSAVTRGLEGLVVRVPPEEEALTSVARWQMLRRPSL